ncbi:hypothetical protein M9Y10_007756 [Tritrichomonas musculus]|uniref:Uncharacterized protein n=1 Tax=Tritrichomonas musculus TaxID=1915356 RepID=A0ABR2J3U3_9EUKA
MLSNLHIIEDHQDEEITKEKENPRNVQRNGQSTDTDPEAEAENRNINRNNIQMSENNLQNEEDVKRKKRYKSGFAKLIDKLPSYKYDIPKKQKNQMKQKNQKNQRFRNLIPLNVRDTGNNRFYSYNEAFSYIAEHCHQNNLKFSRENCRQYLNECYIIDFARDEFIPITSHLSQKEFNRYFYLKQRELKYL